MQRARPASSAIARRPVLPGAAEPVQEHERRAGPGLGAGHRATGDIDAERTECPRRARASGNRAARAAAGDRQEAAHQGARERDVLGLVGACARHELGGVGAARAHELGDGARPALDESASTSMWNCTAQTASPTR